MALRVVAELTEDTAPSTGPRQGMSRERSARIRSRRWSGPPRRTPDRCWEGVL